MAPPAVPHGDIQGQEGECLQQDGDEAAFQQHWVTSRHGGRAGTVLLQGGGLCCSARTERVVGAEEKASPCAASHCTGIFQKPPLAAFPAQSQPSTSGLESLGAACNNSTDKSTNAASHGGISHGEGEITQNRSISPSVPGHSNVPKQLGRRGAVPAAVPRQSIPRDCGGSGHIAGCLASTHEAAHSCGCS